jgi:carbon monoxide dehydrogenase subunit G
MYQAARAATLNATADDVWRIVSDFQGLSRFHPLISVTHPENHGLWRRDMFKDLDQGSLEERLHFSDRSRCYSYRSLNAGGGFFPIDSYFGKFKVWPRGDGSSGVIWSAQLIPQDPENVAANEAMVPQMIENETAGLEGLIGMFGGAHLPPEPHDYAAAAVAELDADAETLWDLVGDFFGIADWIPNVAQVERVSNGRRFVHLGSHPQIDAEDELFRDDSRRTYSYSTRLEPDSGYPCDDYIANVKVWTLGAERCGIVWSGQFTPSNPEDREESAKVAAMMQHEYDSSLAGLAERFGGGLRRAQS